MNISLALHDPLRPRSHGPQPVGHLCRHFVSMGSAAVESLDSACDQPQLWWNRLGPDFSIGTCPPDSHPFPSNNAKLFDVQAGESGINLPLSDCLSEENHQQRLLAQVNPTLSQSQFLDHTDVAQEHSIHGSGSTLSEERIEHGRAPADVAFLSSDGESHPQSVVVMSECLCKSNHSSEEALEIPVSARVKLLCSYGGRIMPRPVDGKLRYVGGETRIIAVNKNASFAEFMSKMTQFYGNPLGVKYQLPDEDLDGLVSVSSDDDLQNMMEEYDKVGSSGSASRLRLFFFSVPAEVEVSELKMDGEDGLLVPNQRYVDAINGVRVSLSDDDAGGLHQPDSVNTLEGRGRIPSFEHVNEMSQLKGLSAPSSSPSSPPLASRQASYHKSPSLVDFSLNELLNKTSKVPKGFEGDVELEGLASSATIPLHHQGDHMQYDHQFFLAADSPRVPHHDFSLSRAGENWPGLHRVGSQTKLGRQSEQHAEYRMNVGGHSDHWHEVQHSREAVTPHSDHHPFIPQHKHSVPSQHQHHHQWPLYHHHQQHPVQQQQQGWYGQGDVDSGRQDQSHQDINRQLQGVQLHQQHPLHGHYTVSMHDQCNWNAEYPVRSAEHNAVTPFVHGSTQINPQILLGMAPSLFHVGSAPSSPKVGVYDFQGKCSCGLQHSQVHRGITVSIGEQSHTRSPFHYGDQAVRKQSFWNSLRFYDNASHTVDSSLWQQATHLPMTGEADHREHCGGYRQQYPGRLPRDFHVTDSQMRSRAMQYSETLMNERELQPASIERLEMNKRCLCPNGIDSRRQPTELMAGQAVYSEAPDLLHQNCFDSDGGRVYTVRKQLHRVPSYKEEIHRVEFVDDRLAEGESGLSVSQVSGDSESRKAMASYVDGGHHVTKPAISLGAPPSNFSVLDDTLVSKPSMQDPSDWHPSARTSMGTPGNWADEFLPQQCENFIAPMEASNISLRMSAVCSTPDMLEEGANPSSPALVSDVQHLNSTLHSFYVEDDNSRAVSGARVHCSAASGNEFVDLEWNGSKMPTSISVAGQGVPSRALIISNMQQATVSPVYDQSPFSSINTVDFSFAAGKSKPPLEVETEKKLSASCMSSTEFLVDSVASSSVLDSCLHEEFSSDSSVAAQDVAFVDDRKITQDQAITREMESSNPQGVSVTELVKGLSSLSTEDASIGGGCLEAGTEKVAGQFQEEIGGAHAEESGDVKKRSSEEKDSEVGIPGTEDSTKPALSEAETEAIARGLQIIRNSDLEDLKELGSGTYGTVFHGKWRGSDVAIKRIKASCFTGPPSEQERLISDFWKEACTLGQLHHPNVVAFYGIVPDGPGGTLATVTEYMVNGSLKQVLHKKDRTIDRRKRLFIAMDAAFGMEYLHSKNIVHFDLKCENLLVNMRDAHRPICKVGDFGLSKVKHQTLVSGGVRGTLPWMAPELLSGNSSMVSEKIDVFSFGIVMWELLTGEEPYANMHFGAIIGGIVKNTLRPSIPSWCDPGWRSLMERCWSGDPAERPAFAEVARELRAIAATMNLK